MAKPQSIRHLNEIQVLATLLQARRGLSRAELARRVGLNRSSIGSVVAGLVEAGLVRERDERADIALGGESESEQVGRPGIAIEINPDGGAFIGVEIGIERLAVWVVDLAGEEIGHHEIAYDAASAGVGAVVQRIGELVREACERCFVRAAPVRGLGVALPALVDKTGRVINGFVLGWRDVPLRQMLLDELGPEAGEFPIVVENDANAFGVAALWRNPALMSGTVAFLTMENGVGGGVFHDGQLFRGSAGYAGEFGHLLLAGDKKAVDALPPSQHRRPPTHFENHVGKDAVLGQHYRAVLGGREEGAHTVPLSDPRSPIPDPQAHLDWIEFLAACRSGQPVALQVAKDWGAKMAYGLTQISVVLNPRCIVLGGSVATLFEFVAEDVRAAISRELIEGFPMPEIRVSPLGEDGTPLGVALLMHRRFFSVDEQLLSKAQLS